MVTGNNFLFILFGLTAGFAASSFVLSGKNLKTVTVERRLPREIFAETPFAVEYHVKTSSRFGASVLTLREAEPFEAENAPVNIPCVAPGEDSRQTALRVLPSRGEFELGPVWVSTSFPFGLAERWSLRGERRKALVFPRIEPVRVAAVIPAYFQGDGVERDDPVGDITRYFRDYAPGDPMKHIDWKKTAGTGRLTSRVMAEETSREILIKLPAGAGERAISRAASVAVHFGRIGAPVAFVAPGINLSAGTGTEHITRILTILAKWDGSSMSKPVSRHTPAGRRIVTVELNTEGDIVSSPTED
jgi:uncharacterized protein (DUF58 family)